MRGGTGQEEGESPQARDGSHSGTLAGMVCPVVVPSLGGTGQQGWRQHADEGRSERCLELCERAGRAESIL